MKLPKKVKIVEVGPRDGLQGEPEIVPTEKKIALINRLSSTGLQAIEVTSFVSPKWVPQMADNAQVMAGITKHSGVSYPVLTPNLKGFEAAIAAGANEVAMLCVASESFSRKNLNCSLAQNLEGAEDVIVAAKARGIKVRGYISCAFDCPYEGRVPPTDVVRIAQRLFELGCYEISLGDTLGMGTPSRVQNLLNMVTRKVPVEQMAVHFHNTYNQALSNVLVALEVGITVVDSSVAGLGGCPFAKGSSGNLASEDLLYMLNGLGIETGINLQKLVATGHFISDQLGRHSGSQVALATQFKDDLL